LLQRSHYPSYRPGGLTNASVEKLNPLLTPQKPWFRRLNQNHRTTINGILWIDRAGTPWRNLPEHYGKPWPDAVTVGIKREYEREFYRNCNNKRITQTGPNEVSVLLMAVSFVRINSPLERKGGSRPRKPLIRARASSTKHFNIFMHVKFLA